MKKKKNKFWLFVFSLFPGAGHMYMGFMRMGLSFMMGFLLLIGLVGITNIGVLAVFPITLYVYSFFHANNVGGLDDEEFAALDDEYLFGLGDWKGVHLKLDGKNRKMAAVVLIVLGLYMLWDVGFGLLRDYMGWDNPVIRVLYYAMRNEVPRVVIAVAIIWFGMSLLRGKKVDFTERDTERKSREPVMQIVEVVQTEAAQKEEPVYDAEQMHDREMPHDTEQGQDAEQIDQLEQKGE